jgi:dTDP-4-amino-4,6-dideoxygalactose transaminase
MKKVPFVDLISQYHGIKEEILESLQGVMETSDFILGKEECLFEEEFAVFCQAPFAIGVGSGLDALRLALKAFDIGPGDEVITTANTYIATTLAISETGAKPVLVDVDPENYNIDASLVEKALSPSTKAVIPVHLYGQPVNMDPLYDLAEEYKFKIIEDAAQAHGARFKEKRTGTLADAACFSFYPGKNLGAYGDGGMVVTADEEVAEKVKMLRNYGQKKKYYHSVKGGNSRLDTVQAAILRIKLKHLDAWNLKRREHADYYRKTIDSDKAVLPQEMDYAYHVYHLFVIRHKRRDELLQALAEANIYAGIHYPIPIHLQDCYQDLGYPKGSFKVTESYADQILSLPMFPELLPEQIEAVAQVINEF